MSTSNRDPLLLTCLDDLSVVVAIAAALALRERRRVIRMPEERPIIG